MASIPTTLYLSNRLDLSSIHTLVSLVNHHIHHFLSHPIARKPLQLQCSSKFTITNGCRSDHSVLSNLYWGIESLELAIQSECPEDRASRLADSERMLQIPALLEEDGTTAGIANGRIVCYGYFYLSMVRKLRGDEWQMTMHLLQSVLVSPRCIRTEIAPRLIGSIFGDLAMGGGGGGGGGEEKADEAVRQQARRYKDWLMYYQVVSYGEPPPWSNGSSVVDTCNRGSQNCQ